MKKHLILGGNLKTSLYSLGYTNFKVIRKDKKTCHERIRKIEHLIHKNINTTCACANIIRRME